MMKSEDHQAVLQSGTRNTSTDDGTRHLSQNFVCSGAERGLGVHKLRTLPFKRKPISVVREGPCN